MPPFLFNKPQSFSFRTEGPKFSSDLRPPKTEKFAVCTALRGCCLLLVCALIGWSLQDVLSIKREFTPRFFAQYAAGTCFLRPPKTE